MNMRKICCVILGLIIACIFVGCGSANTPVTQPPSGWKACYYCGEKPQRIFYINGVYICADCHNDNVFKRIEEESDVKIRG